jgi:hypothetical protein
MDDYQHGVMAGMDDNVERLTGQEPMSVGDFARAHMDQLNPRRASSQEILILAVFVCKTGDEQGAIIQFSQGP